MPRSLGGPANMRSLSSIVLALAIASANASELTYLSCSYDGELMADRKVLITVNTVASTLKWEDFYARGKAEDVYTIKTASASEIVATMTKADAVWAFTLNRVNGRWRKQFPIGKDQNPKLGYPDDVQLQGSFSGWCEVATAKF